MTCGTVFLMWLGEQIDEFGIGNGISLLIMAGILAQMPNALWKLFKDATFNRHHEGFFFIAINDGRYLAVAASGPGGPLSTSISLFRGKRFDISHAEFSIYSRPGNMPGS